MATVACPGCGLPRAESEVGATPCPVCAASAAPPNTGNSRPSARNKADADPTAGLPADVSELNAPGTANSRRTAEGGSRVPLIAGAFLLGALCGIGGVFGYQAIDWPKNEPEVAAKPTIDLPPVTIVPTGPALAPMPHEPAPKPLVFGPGPDEDPDPEPDVKVIPAPVPGRVTTHEFNEPGEVYSVPVLKKGEHVVLKGKGKIKTLRIHGLDAGAVLNASELEAETITVSGKIDNGSKLYLKATNGKVQLSAKVDARSVVEINAPGGEVKFTAQTTPNREGSKIDNGSTVTITARTVEFKGDIAGADTKVSLVLTRNAFLKVASVSGKALVEYKSQVAGWSPPDVIVGPVAPSATFRKIE